MTTNYAARIAAAKTIGSGIATSDITVPEIVASVPEGFDHKARGAVADLVHTWLCGDLKRPQVMTGPAGAQVKTLYGIGHASLVSKVKAELAKSEAKPVRLAVTMSGTDAPTTGTVTIPTDHPLYADLVALIAAASETE